jgi:hypothetical protein
MKLFELHVDIARGAAVCSLTFMLCGQRSVFQPDYLDPRWHLHERDLEATVSTSVKTLTVGGSRRRT